jgi:hypothetical protein
VRQPIHYILLLASGGCPQPFLGGYVEAASLGEHDFNPEIFRIAQALLAFFYFTIEIVVCFLLDLSLGDQDETSTSLILSTSGQKTTATAHYKAPMPTRIRLTTAATAKV